MLPLSVFSHLRRENDDSSFIPQNLSSASASRGALASPAPTLLPAPHPLPPHRASPSLTGVPEADFIRTPQVQHLPFSSTFIDENIYTHQKCKADHHSLSQKSLPIAEPPVQAQEKVLYNPERVPSPALSSFTSTATPGSTRS